MSSSTPSIVDVLIVGAGPAGLTAAYDLFWMEYNVTVLEARGDIGGRIRKNTNFTDFDLDLGAEWIHTDPSILDTIVDDPKSPVDVDTYSDKNTYGEYDIDWKEWYYEETMVNDYKFLGYTWYDFWKEYIAVDIEHLIEFNCVVTEIEWDSDPVTARCADDRTFQAKHIIVTAPLVTLANGNIDFVPSLPDDVQEAIDAAGAPENYGSGTKSWLKFEQKFWTNPTFGLSTDYLPDERGERTFYDASSNQDSDEIVLGIVCLGKMADQYLGWTEDDIIDDFLTDLVTMYGSVARESYTGEYLLQNWNNEPFAQGAYTLYVDSGYWPVETLRKSFGGNLLWFAGEGIPRGSWENGYCHEASKSGRLAAEEIMALSTESSADQTKNSAAGYAAPYLQLLYLLIGWTTVLIFQGRDDGL